MKKMSEMNVDVAMMDTDISGLDCGIARVSIIGDILGFATGGVLWLTGFGLEMVGAGAKLAGGTLVEASANDYEKNVNTLKKYEKQQINKKIDKKEEEIAVLKAGLKMI